MNISIKQYQYQFVQKNKREWFLDSWLEGYAVPFMFISTSTIAIAIATGSTIAINSIVFSACTSIKQY